MQLYQLAYGWTEQRFYALAGIAWLVRRCVCGVLVGVTRHAGFAASALIGLAIAIAINLIGRAPTSRARTSSASWTRARYLRTRVTASTRITWRPLGRRDTNARRIPARLGASDRVALGRRYVRSRSRPRPRSGPASRFSLDRERARQALLTVADEVRRYPLQRPAPFRRRPESSACPGSRSPATHRRRRGASRRGARAPASPNDRASQRRRSSDSPFPDAISPYPCASSVASSARCFCSSRFTLGSA